MEASFYPQILTVVLGLLIWLPQRQTHPQDSSSQGSGDEWFAQFWNLYNMSCCVEQDQVAQNIIDQELTGTLQFVQASHSRSTIAPKSQMKRYKENQHLVLHPCITFSVIPSCNFKREVCGVGARDVRPSWVGGVVPCWLAQACWCKWFHSVPLGNVASSSCVDAQNFGTVDQPLRPHWTCTWGKCGGYYKSLAGISRSMSWHNTLKCTLMRTWSRSCNVQEIKWLHICSKASNSCKVLRDRTMQENRHANLTNIMKGFHWNSNYCQIGSKIGTTKLKWDNFSVANRPWLLLFWCRSSYLPSLYSLLNVLGTNVVKETV